MNVEKIIVARLMGLLSEYKVLDTFTKEEAKKVEGYKPFMEECRKNKTAFPEVREQLAKYMESVNNLRVLKDDIFNVAGRIAEVIKIIDMLALEVNLEGGDKELVDACIEFVKPVYFVEEGKIKVQETQYNDYINQLKEEINKDANSIEMEYNQMLAQ